MSTLSIRCVNLFYFNMCVSTLAYYMYVYGMDGTTSMLEFKNTDCLKAEEKR